MPINKDDAPTGFTPVPEDAEGSCTGCEADGPGCGRCLNSDRADGISVIFKRVPPATPAAKPETPDGLPFNKDKKILVQKSMLIHGLRLAKDGTDVVLIVENNRMVTVASKRCPSGEQQFLTSSAIGRMPWETEWRTVVYAAQQVGPSWANGQVWRCSDGVEFLVTDASSRSAIELLRLDNFGRITRSAELARYSDGYEYLGMHRDVYKKKE